MLEFGHKEANREYLDRPGAYVVIFRPGGQTASIEGNGKLYLIGGGSEPGETPEETAIRETREEVGLQIRVGAKIGEANDSVTRMRGLLRNAGSNIIDNIDIFP